MLAALTLCSSLPFTVLFSVPLKASRAPTAAPDCPTPEDVPATGAPYCKNTLIAVASERSGHWETQCAHRAALWGYNT